MLILVILSLIWLCGVVDSFVRSHSLYHFVSGNGNWCDQWLRIGSMWIRKQGKEKEKKKRRKYPRLWETVKEEKEDTQLVIERLLGLMVCQMWKVAKR